MSSMTTTAPDGGTRMRSEDRRALVLEAATLVFGERGYHGATTDAVARAAGVSQPYVVRMFGGKEAMFLAVLDRTLDRIIGAFREALDENRRTADPDDVDALAMCIGRNYVDLLRDRGLLLSLMQAFLLGADPDIGPHARAGFRRVYRYLRDEVGLPADRVHEVLAQGMLINTVVGLKMVDDIDDDPAAAELLGQLFPTKLEVLLSMRESAS